MTAGTSRILSRDRFLKGSVGRVSYNVLGLYRDYGSKVTIDSYEMEVVLKVKGQMSSGMSKQLVQSPITLRKD